MTRTVLLIHSDEGRRARVRDWLAGASVVEVPTRMDALPLLESAAPFLVIAEPKGFNKLLRDLERHAPAAKRAVLCPSADAEQVRAELVALAAQGYDFTTVDETDRSQVERLLSSRASARLTPGAPLHAAFELGGRLVRCAVVELGNDGLGLAAGPQTPRDLLDPGARLENARVLGVDGVVTEPRTWVTRAVWHEGLNQLHVGVSFEQARVEAPPPWVNDSVKVAGWVQRAVVREKPFWLQAADASVRDAFDRAELDLARGELRLLRPSGALRWAPGDAVVVSFTSGLVHTECPATVLRQGPEQVVLAVPRRGLQYERRRALRMVLRGGADATLAFRSPLDGQPRCQRLLDLMPQGAAFEFDAHKDVFPPGLLLQDAALEVAGRRLPVTAVVQGTALLGEGARRRCGVRLAVPSEQEQAALLDLLVTDMVPETTGSRDVPFERVWSLFTREHAHFPDYPVDDPGTLERLREPQVLLARAPGLGRPFVAQADDRVVGFSSGLRVYSRTWLSQHLITEAGYHRSSTLAQALVSLSFHYGEALEDVEYLRGLWRLDNRWAARVYGATTPRLVHTGISYLWPFHVGRRSLVLPASPRLSATECRAHQELLAHLGRTMDPAKVAADDLTEHELLLPSLGRRYRAAGLERWRRVGVVEGRHGPRGWVLVEHCSEGLFFMNLYSHHRFFLVEPEADDAKDVLAALDAWAVAEHRAAGERWSTCVVSPDQLPAMLELGYHDLLGPSMEFGAHRSLTREMTSEMLTLFERLAVRSRLRHGEAA